MNRYRLLVDWEVIEKLGLLPWRTRRVLRDALARDVFLLAATGYWLAVAGPRASPRRT